MASGERNGAGDSSLSLPSITVVIPNRDGIEHLKSCLGSLRVMDYPRELLEILVIDNASADESVQYVTGEFPSVLVIENETDQGMVSAFNQGARIAAGAYIAFLGGDMRVDSQWLRELIAPILAARAEDDVALVCTSAQILNWAGDRVDSRDRRINLFGHDVQVDRGRSSALIADRTAPCPTPFPSESAMLIDRTIFLDIEGFDEDFSPSYAGIDLGYRLWMFGLRVCRAPGALTYHHTDALPDADAIARRRDAATRDPLMLCYKNFEDDHVLGTVLGNLLLMGTQAAGELTTAGIDLHEPMRGDAPPVPVPATAIGALAAAQAFVSALPRLREKRDRVQRRRVRSDQELALQLGSAFHSHVPPALMPDFYTVIQAVIAPERYAETPRRVALLCGDVLPLPGVPTSGAGMRVWGLGKGLESRGHEVIWMVHREILRRMEQIATVPIPPSWRESVWTSPASLTEVFARIQPELVVVGGWPTALSLPDVVGAPLVIDQAGPHILERFFARPQTAESDLAEKVAALRKADFFVSSGDVQQTYFEGWLALAGFPRDARGEIDTRATGVIPFSLAPELPVHPPREGNRPLTFVYGGYFLPWQDPSLPLRTVAAWAGAHDAILRIYGGPPPFHTIDPGVMGELVRELRATPSVEVRGVLPFDALVAEYAAVDVAIDLMQRNRERELAFTTRTVVYLWAGVPVIYNNYSELSGLITEYDAGWILDPEDECGLRTVLDAIAANPEIIARKGANAQRLVRERFTWDTTIEPLDAFCRMPFVRVKTADGTVGDTADENTPAPAVFSSSPPATSMSEHALGELARARRRPRAGIIAIGRLIAKTLLRVEKVVEYYDTLARVSPPLVGTTAIVQRFSAAQSVIAAVDVRFATFGRTNTPTVTATIAVEGSAVRRIVSVPAASFVDGAYVRFEFDAPVRRVQGKSIVLTLSSPNGVYGDSVAPWLRVSPAVAGEPARRGRRPLSYPLDFQPVYGEYKRHKYKEG